MRTTASFDGGRTTVLVVGCAAKLDPAGADNDTSRIGVGYDYLLSKRTSLMVNMGSADQEGSVGGRPRTRTQPMRWASSTTFDGIGKHSFANADPAGYGQHVLTLLIVISALGVLRAAFDLWHA